MKKETCTAQTCSTEKRCPITNAYQEGLKFLASSERLGANLIRVAILIIFMWIGGLKFWNYEAQGIVPFVANSPFMSFFYDKPAPEYKAFKMKEGEYNEEKVAWHKENNTYGYSKGLGLVIMTIGLLAFLGMFSARIGLVGALLVIWMMIGTLSFLVTTPEVWVTNHVPDEMSGFPLLSGAGRLVIKDTAIMAGAFVLLSDCAKRILAQKKIH